MPVEYRTYKIAPVGQLTSWREFYAPSLVEAFRLAQLRFFAPRQGLFCLGSRKGR